jgi:hypothetical protein
VVQVNSIVQVLKKWSENPSARVEVKTNESSLLLPDSPGPSLYKSDMDRKMKSINAIMMENHGGSF